LYPYFTPTLVKNACPLHLEPAQAIDQVAVFFLLPRLSARWAVDQFQLFRIKAYRSGQFLEYRVFDVPMFAARSWSNLRMNFEPSSAFDDQLIIAMADQNLTPSAGACS
jgi:hypothetical protein